MRFDCQKRLMGLAFQVLTIIANAPAFAAESPVVDKLPYAQARAVLIDQGFRPYALPGAPECDPASNRCFPEIESCVQKRYLACNYTWRNGKEIYHVETRAQKKEPPVVDRFYCFLNCGHGADTKVDVTAAGAQKL